MYHDDFAKAYDFLGLRGYAICHDYHHLEETKSYRHLSHYYASHYHKLLKTENLTQPKIIPEMWHKYTTMDVDTNTKRNSIKDLMTKWVEWERSTKKLYQEMRHELTEIGELAAAQYVDTLILDVSKELRHAERKLIMLETISYDLVSIAEEQDELYKKYKNKIRW